MVCCKEGGNYASDRTGAAACHRPRPLDLPPGPDRAIPLALGFIDIQDMPIWVYAWNMIVQNFLAPRHRVYKTVNIFQEFAVRNKIRMEDLDDEIVTTPKERKRKKKEYEAKLKEFVRTFPEYEEFK